MTHDGDVVITNKDKSSTFLVNGLHVKYYLGNDLDQDQEALELNDE